MNAAARRTLGRSGLPVSPAALGTMTFGNQAWGSPDDVSATIFDAYLEAGGNFVDTADVYAGGRSEELVGKLTADRKLRDKLILATKWSFAGGNGRKNMHRALEGSLRRLGTDYVDLYWMHVWDRVTPVEETLESFVGLIRSGKIRYYGLSDVPAWYASRMVTLAQAHALPGPIALQMPYSLAERTIEQEHIPLAQELGLGLTPWSPLAFGFLTGRYTRTPEGKAASESGRLNVAQHFQNFGDRQWSVLEVLRRVSEAAGKPMAQVALAWAAARPAVSSLIFGASKVEQLQQNLAALELALTPEQTAELDRSNALDQSSPYAIFSDEVQRNIFGGIDLRAWRG